MPRRENDLIKSAEDKFRHCWSLVSEQQPVTACELFESLITGEYTELGAAEDVLRQFRLDFARHLIENNFQQTAYIVYVRIIARDCPASEDARELTEELATSMYKLTRGWLLPHGEVSAAKDLFELCRNIWLYELGDEQAARKCQKNLKWIARHSVPSSKPHRGQDQTQSNLLTPNHRLSESRSSSALVTAELNSRLENSKLVSADSDDNNGASQSRRPRSVDIPRDEQQDQHLPATAPNFAYQGFDAQKGILLRTDQDSADDSKWFQYLRERSHPMLNSQPHRKSGNVKIAILDTGLDGKHAFFSDFFHRIKAFKSWVESDRSIGPIKRGLTVSQLQDVCTDHYGHGSLVASLLLRVTPYADVYIAQVAKTPKDVSAEMVASAIEYAIQTWKVDIISLSLGFQRVQDSIRRSLKLTQDRETMSAGKSGSNIRKRNVLIFAAASNEGANVGTNLGVTYPASDPHVICVDAAHCSGNPWDFNPQGNREYGLCSMGVKVRGPWPMRSAKDNMKEDSGTSYAAPIVAGIAALLLEFLLQESSKDRVPAMYEELADASTGSLKHVLRGCARRQHENFYYIAPWLLDMDVEQHGSVENARRETLATIRRTMRDRLNLQRS